MTDSISWQDFELVLDSERVIAPCFRLALFLDTTDYGNILDFYERALAALGTVAGFRADYRQNWRPWNDRAATMVPTWLSKPREDKQYHIQIRGEGNAGVAAAAIELSLIPEPAADLTPELIERRKQSWRVLYEEQGWQAYPPVSMLEVTLPVDHELIVGQRLCDWVKDFALIKDGPFLSGYAGYALNHDDSIGDSTLAAQINRRVMTLGARFPGLDLTTRGIGGMMLHYDAAWVSQKGYFAPRIKRVNWLTLIGQDLAAYLGGAPTLETTIADEDVVLHPLDGGLMIQAGAEPRLGDLGRRDFLPAYRAVARALRNVRLASVPSMGPELSSDSLQTWLDAFDRDFD